MSVKGFSTSIIALLFIIVFSHVSFAQVWEKPTNGIEDPVIDSIYENLSITERVGQLLMIDARNKEVNDIDFSMAFGGILFGSTSPVHHLNSVQKVQNLFAIPPLCFSELEEPLGISMDSLDHFGSSIVFENIYEPNLIYETGLALSKQCKYLAINALLTKKNSSLFSGDFSKTYWKYAELNQGMVDGGMLPMDYFKVLDFNALQIQDLFQQNQAIMIKLLPDEVPDYHQKLQEAIAGDSLSLEQLEIHIKRLLSIKRRLQLGKIDVAQNAQKLRKLNFYNLKYELAKASIKLKNNPDELIPVRSLENKKIASISFGNNKAVFDEYLEKYTMVDHFEAQFDMSIESYTELWNKLINYDLVICSLHKPYMPNNENFKIFEGWLINSSKCIWASFLGDEYTPDLEDKHQGQTLITAPEDNTMYQSIIPQVIFGGTDLEGYLPSSEALRFLGTYPVNGIGRFSYSYPEAVGLNSNKLSRIDSLAKFAIEQLATPGCQILVAKDNQVIYQKSFGYHTYDSIREVRNDDLYDLASVTKVSGALPGLMKLYEEGKFDLDATLGTYLKYFRRGNKKKLTFREILAHQSGLKSWIPYWQTTIRKNGKYRRKTLSTVQSENYPYEVAQDLFLHKSYKKKIYKQIRKSDLGEKKYLYSGLTFYIFPEIIEKITGQSYEDYIYSNFYQPLGSTTLRYNPDELFDVDRIVPTEYDSLFRKSQIHGKVHDEGAAMMGGVSSNAGLFSDANDLAKLWQMYCNYGEYGGRRYLKEETVREFARCQYPENDNRRALGFDRPLPEPIPDGNTAVSVSQSSFGHTGFTGTFAWSDPENHIVYIFLSNRVYPTRANTKLYNLNIRTDIQQVIYDARIE